jgi:hypothetical protein
MMRIEMGSATQRRIRPWILLAVVIGIGLLGVLGARHYRANRSHQSPDQSVQGRVADLYISPAKLDFGSVWESSSSQWVLPIENRGEEDVEIEDLVATCGCTNIEPRSVTVPAHQSREVRVTVDLTQGGQQKADSITARAFEVQLRPKLQTGMTLREGDRWGLRGTVRPLLRIQPTAVDLGDVSELSLTASVRTVQVTSIIPLKSLKVVPDQRLLLSEVKRIPGGGERYELTVAVPPTPRLGQIEQDVILDAELEAGEMVKRAVHVTGRVVKDYQSYPAQVTFGAQVLGEEAEESVTICSLTRRALEILDTTIQGDGLRLEDTPAIGIEGVTLRLRQKILKPGEQTGKVVVKVRAVGDMTEVVVPVTYHGINP